MGARKFKNSEKTDCCSKVSLKNPLFRGYTKLVLMKVKDKNWIVTKNDSFFQIFNITY